MRTLQPAPQHGSTLVVTISVVAAILTLLGSAVAYTQHVSRVSDRSRKAAQALEIGDGHLEYLFTHWRAISRAPGFRLTISQPPTNFFFTSEYNPGPAPTPWSSPRPSPWPGTPAIIPKPPASLFPDVPNFNVTQYRIQAVTPMVELTSTENSTLATTAHPPYAYGANFWQYSVFYLASVDVTIPVLNGTVSARVRRIFEKKYDNPWTFAIFYNDDLELHPDSTLVIDGPIHSNANLYVGKSTLTVQDSSNQIRPPSTVTFGGEYLNGFSPNDTTSRSGGITKPTFPEKLPPAQESPYLPFGWNLKLTNEDGSVNNDSYHELIERPVTESGTPDPLAEVRFYSQAGVKVLIDPNKNNANNFVVYRPDPSFPTDATKDVECKSNSSNANDKKIWEMINAALTTNQSVYDYREGGAVRVTDLKIDQITSAVDNGTITGFNGVLYIADVSANPSSTPTPLRRGIRLRNGTHLPIGRVNKKSESASNEPGLTVVSENPVYIQGNYNTGGTSPPSNSNPASSPVHSGYGRRQAAIIADAITVLSSNWQDSYGVGTSRPSRPAVSTTINAALVAGIVPSGGGSYSGGAENFIRLLEDWNSSNRTFCYYGSMVQLYNSVQANTPWSGSGNIYKEPINSRYFWDSDFGKNPSEGQPFYGSPPGKLQISAYLQQQRWYQVY